MTTRSSATQLLGAIAAAMLLAGATASAQTIAKPDQRGAVTAAAKPAQPVKSAQPAKPAKPAAASASAAASAARHRLLGDQHRPRPIPRYEAGPGADRSGPRATARGAGDRRLRARHRRTGQLADGRAAPGLERYNQDPQSYAGMSLSVTSSNKSFLLPTQLLPHNQW